MRRLILSLLLLTAVIGFGAVMAQQVHVVQRGENLYTIARQYGLTLQEVAQANGMSEPYIIHAGNEIIIPPAGGSPAQTQGTRGAAPPAPTVPTDVDNCCFVDRHCETEQEWEDGYWAHWHGHCPAPVYSETWVQPDPQPVVKPGALPALWSPTGLRNPYDIDNCCHLDRSCHTDEEWKAGYVAFKELECWDLYHAWARTPIPGYMPASGSDNCCTAPGWLCLNDKHYEKGRWAFSDYGHCNPRVRVNYLPTSQYYDATDNCCHIGWDCQTSADWERGYSDFLHFRCEFSVPLISHIPVQVVGSPAFTRHTRVMFSLLKARSPYYYDYAARAMDKHIQKSPSGHRTHNPSCGAENIHLSAFPDVLESNYWKTFLHQTSVVVHEACHCVREHSGQDARLLAEAARHPLEPDFMDGNRVTEVPCMEEQFSVLRQLDPGDSLKFAATYARGIVLWLDKYPWLGRFLQKPKSHYQHYLAVGP